MFKKFSMGLAVFMLKPLITFCSIIPQHCVYYEINQWQPLTEAVVVSFHHDGNDVSNALPQILVDGMDDLRVLQQLVAAVGHQTVDTQHIFQKGLELYLSSIVAK